MSNPPVVTEALLNNGHAAQMTPAEQTIREIKSGKVSLWFKKRTERKRRKEREEK